MSKYDSSDRARFYIGVDGGGTSCRARTEDAEGRLPGQGAGGPAAIDAGLPPTALAQASASVGLAGIDRKEAREALLSFSHPLLRVVCASDPKVACLGAHSGHDGAIVFLRMVLVRSHPERIVVLLGNEVVAEFQGRELR